MCFNIIICSILSISYLSMAGTIENVNGMVMYKTQNGNYATNTWAWLDING